MFFKRKKLPEFLGYMDFSGDGHVTGWVYDRLRPKTRLDVEIYMAGQMLGVTHAGVFREDLLQARIGDGSYGFSFQSQRSDFAAETISVKVKGEEFWLLEGGSGRLRGIDPEMQLMNSTRRGMPALRPGLSSHVVDDADVEIATQLQREWREHIGAGKSETFVGRRSMWTDIVSARHASLIDLLNGSDPRALATHLVDIQKLSASTGLVQGDRAYRDFLAASPEGRRAAIAPFHDMLASLVQYMGLARAECSEQNFVGATLIVDSERLVAQIESRLGVSIVPPNVFDGLYGLAIHDRILHGRDIQALYAALRVIEASTMDAPAICEIGGGFGKVAHYAWMRGVRRYIIVDLPTVSAMQYFYLRRALPNVQVSFKRPAEISQGDEGVSLVFASHIDGNTKLASDIVFNCDSFPEMGDAVCKSYFAVISQWAPLLLSINQEANREITGPDNRQSVVGDLLPDFGFVRRYRFRSWVRRGYVEELWSAPKPSDEKELHRVEQAR